MEDTTDSKKAWNWVNVSVMTRLLEEVKKCRYV